VAATGREWDRKTAVCGADGTKKILEAFRQPGNIAVLPTFATVPITVTCVVR
jgi:hypothetical protein